MSLAISRLLYSTWVSLPLGLELLPYPEFGEEMRFTLSRLDLISSWSRRLTSKIGYD